MVEEGVDIADLFCNCISFCSEAVTCAMIEESEGVAG